MRLQEITALGELGLHIYLINRDPLTFSAAKIMLQCTSSDTTPPQKNAITLLQRQVAAYNTLFTEPLV